MKCAAEQKKSPQVQEAEVVVVVGQRGVAKKRVQLFKSGGGSTSIHSPNREGTWQPGLDFPRTCGQKVILWHENIMWGIFISGK